MFKSHWTAKSDYETVHVNKPKSTITLEEFTTKLHVRPRSTTSSTIVALLHFTLIAQTSIAIDIRVDSIARTRTHTH
jgi:hypothetical protein